MSRNVTHGKSPEQKTANHEKRLLAIERGIAAGQTAGIPALRDALYTAASATRGEVARNMDPGLAGASINVGSGGTRWCAVYWPGGNTVGMTFILSTVGVYTDTSPNSGGAVYSYDGTTLTRQATAPQKWDSTFGAGLNLLNWGSNTFLVAGVYYIAIRYFNTAVTTAPLFGANQAADGTVWGNDAKSNATPTGWPLMFVGSGASGQLPATQAASGLTVGTATSLPYVGLA